MVEVVNLLVMGNFGGFGLFVILSWVVGGLLVVGVVWMIGKIVLGLWLDYFVIVMFGIVEIIVVVFKNEDWLLCGVKNVNGLFCFVL